MFARALVILAMVVVASKVEGKAGLRGVILANELSGPPMGNAEVSAVGGNPNNTGADGKFTFTFSNRNPGNTVRLTVRKEGYVVVNDIQLELALPADPEERPAIYLLCKEGERQEMARRFYRLKSLEAIDETYRKKFEEAQNASATELAKLRQERDQAKDAVQKMAEGLAKQQPGAGSELYRTAMRLFLDGKVDEALVTLSDEKLRELSKAAREKKAEAEKMTEETIQNWLLKAQLFTVQFRFDDAEKAYQGAIDTSPDDFKANFAFAAFNQQLNRSDKAMSAYARCLELARRNKDNVEIGMTLNNRALLDKDQNRPAAARQGFDEALKIRRELAKKSPDGYISDVATTLNNLAFLDKDQNQPEAARQGFNEALKILRELAKKSPDSYLSDVATTLNNLALLDKDQNRPEAARQGFDEALKILRELAKKNSDTYLPNVALTLNNRALLDKDQRRPEAARQGYGEALKIRRELAKKNPDTYLPDVATTLNNVAYLDKDQNRPEAARQGFDEALKIRRELAKRSPDTYLADVATTLNNLAFLDKDQNRPEAARQGFDEALKILRELAKRNPDTNMPGVALTLNNLALLDKDQNQPEAARQGFDEALGIYEQLVKQNPERFQSDVARVKDLLKTVR
jgi:hypothetical protein